jgi:hypothetical protein
VLALLVAGFLQLEIGASMRLRVRQWRQDFYGGPRLLVWRDSLPLIAAHPLFGTGPETFGNQFRRRESEELSMAYPDFFQESPHNVPLATMVEQGACGLFALFLLIWVFAAAPPHGADTCAASIWASGVCAFLCLLFIPLTIPGALMLYLAAAMLTAARVDRPAAPASAGRPVRVVAAATAVMLVLAAGAYWRQDVGYRRIQASARAGAANEMAQGWESIAAMSFPGAGDDLSCSRTLASAHAWKLASAASAKAERSSDDVADAAYQSALLALSVNDPVAGERKLRETLDSAPNWYKPHLLLGQLLRLLGRPAESDVEIGRALRLAGVRRAEVEKTLQPTH